MNKKLGHIMSSSRLVCFIAFLAATFAWVLTMPALLFVSITFLIVSAVIYLGDMWKNRVKERDA
ncbi:hypothetical protein KP803_21215 [Vibrio sp. ZSDE26]|uniref:Uncharacterized protein n=1 Tax=Vibrio amylolyticus TaxID=2847292 RepID=A0A9X1XN27_9VIBR|nr:hypothetical protein [Vibrio amylolyticus]MCK6265784.1 hypothetical protein [Vibrio amylolyticus]